jgi:hypothetical protein
MIFGMRHILGWAAGGLLLLAASAQPASAAWPVTPYRPAVVTASVPGVTLPVTRQPGWDWYRTYPWSPYNAWRNPYWYPPYNPNYPYLPGQAYPYSPYTGPWGAAGVRYW